MDEYSFWLSVLWVIFRPIAYGAVGGFVLYWFIGAIFRWVRG